MSERFRTIGLIGKPAEPSAARTLNTLIRHLRTRQVRVLVDEASDVRLSGPRVEISDRASIGKLCDLAIIVGGDGTLLNAAHTLVEYDVPLLGVNRGRLGFLVDVSPKEMIPMLNKILAGQYLEEKRFLLLSKVHRLGQNFGPDCALNDVVVHKSNVARMVELETLIDGQFLNTQRSDGLIVATPTGSTAYALSGGGPLVHPALNAIVLVPICPHTLSNRPIVIDGDSEIEVVVCGSNLDSAQLTCDGQSNVELQQGDRIRIKKKPLPIRILHPPGHDHYKILRAKLNWGAPPQPG